MPDRTEDAPPFFEGDVGAAGFRLSCRAGLEAVPLTAARLGPEVRSCRTEPDDIPPAGDDGVTGGMFLPGRYAVSEGLCVLRTAVPAWPG